MLMINQIQNKREKIEIETEPIKKYNFTAKREAAFKKMVAARKKKLEELTEKQGINKMDDSDNSTYLTDSENSENEKIEPSEHMEPVEDVTQDKDISITIKALMEELQETREENDNLRSILKNTNYLVEILNDQLISFHKQLNEMEIKK